MAFCKGGFSAVKSFLQKIDSVLESLINDITVVTGKIKALEGNLTIQAIISAIPMGTAIEGYLNEALDILYKATVEADTIDKKILEYLNSDTPDLQDGKLVKLAQVAVAVADGKQHPQSFYDTATQVHIEGLK